MIPVRASMMDSRERHDQDFGPLSCTSVAVACWTIAVLANSSAANTVAAAVVVLVTMWWAGPAIKNGKLVSSLLATGAVMLPFALSIGWIIAVVTHAAALQREIDDTLTGMGLTSANYAFALLYACVFALVAALLSRLTVFASMEARLRASLLDLLNTPLNVVLLWLLAISALDIVLAMTGVVSQRALNIGNHESGEVSIFAAFFGMVFYVQIPLNSLAIFKVMRSGRLHHPSIIIIGLSVLMVIFVFFSKGRSSIVYCVAAHLVWFVFFAKKLPSIKVVAATVLIVIPVTYYSLLASNAARYSIYTRSGELASGIDVARDSFVSMGDESLRAAQEQVTLSNIATRPLVLSSMASAMQRQSYGWRHTEGVYFLNSLIWAVPRVLFPDKVNYENAEVLLYSRGISRVSTDTADSLYFAAFVDFSWLGVLVYPAFIAALWLFLLWIASWHGGLFGLVVTSSSLFQFTIGMAESSVNGWIVLPRDLLLAALLMFLFRFVPPLRALRPSVHAESARRYQGLRGR